MGRFRFSVSAIGLAAALLAAQLVPTSAVPRAAAAGNPSFHIERLAGSDRYATAAAISRRFYPNGAPIAFVVSGTVFADGLAAGPAAFKAGGPVLYVTPGSLPAATKTELARLRPSRIVVVGGPSAIAESVRSQLAALAPGGASRIYGADRYATAAALAHTWFPAASVVYVATGENFPDGLAAGAAAAASGAPVLLTRAASLPASTAGEMARLHPSLTVVAGGTAVVSAAVVTQLASYGGSVVRRAGTNRYGTAIALSQGAFPSGAGSVFIASGVGFPDALAAISGAGTQHAPVLLVPGTVLPASVATELTRLHPNRAFLLGGRSVVEVGVAKAIQQRLGICWSANKVPAGASQFIFSVPGATGQMALTFDMGGRLDPALSIVQYLVDNQVCATFFLTGAASQTTIGRQVLSLIGSHPELFEVANHTMHHCDLVTGAQSAGSPYCPTSRPSNAFVAKELNDAATIIRAGTGMEPRPYWRAPFGASDAGVRAAAAAAGYTKTFQWSIDTIDWSTATTTDLILSRVLTKAAAGSIVLMHLGGYHTRDALPSLVSSLRSRGYTLTSLSDMLN